MILTIHVFHTLTRDDNFDSECDFVIFNNAKSKVINISFSVS